MTPAVLVSTLRGSRLAASTEAALQQNLERLLTSLGLRFEREARLAPGERIDFLVEGGIGIEAKAKYGRRPIYRQLERYAAREQISALVLVTGTALGLPATLLGKPVFLVSLGRSAL